MAENTQVVVIGGGYAGLMAANRLTQRDDVTVTLVNPRPKFVHRVRLHQLVGGNDSAVVDYKELLAEGVRLVVDSVARIDRAGRSVELWGGGTVSYDYLVYAVGSGSADPTVPGAAEFAYPIASLEEVQQVLPVLEATPASASLTVVGAGPLGIEVAAELAEQGRSVTLICGGGLGPYLHRRARRSVARQLSALGVTVVEGDDTKVTGVTRDSVQLADGRDFSSAVTLWTAGFGVPELAAVSGLSVDALGRLLTDETLTSVDDQRIVAAGDSAAPSGLALRMSCLYAMPMGARAADTLLSRLEGKQPEPLSQSFGAQCISLGRNAAVFQLGNKSDEAVGLHIDGRLGAKVKEGICNSIPKHLAEEAHKPGVYKFHKMKGGAGRRKALEAMKAEASAVGRVA